VAQESQQLPAVHEAWLPREHALHRPRHGGRQLTALICAVVFFAAPTLMWAFGMRPSEIENHPLAQFPSPASGWSFFTGLPSWATDQLAFRSQAIQAADGISEAIFGESAPHDQSGTDGGGPLPGGPPPAGGGTPAPSNGGSGPLDQAGYRQVVEGSDGWLYYGLDAEAKCAPTRPLAETIARINELRDIVESSGRKFVWVVPPDKSTMVPQYLPSSYPGKECQQAAEGPTWTQLDSDGIVDLRPGLREAARQVGHPVYPPNDTHWGDEGGLVMAAAAANAVQPGVTQTWKWDQVGSYTTSADLPPLLGKQGDKTNVVYDLKPDGVTNRAGKITEIDTPVVSDTPPVTGMVNQKTLVYGDSFTMASSRYLAGAFSNLTMLAFYTDKTTQAEAINQFVNSDVVVLETVERSVSGGYLPFFDDGLLNALKAQLSAHPLK
jgi:acetyltransferase AlgX (SGNH hydrolase-like protein)